jgi:hypothetical protein
VYPGTFLNVSAPAAKKVVTLIEQVRRGIVPNVAAAGSVELPPSR